MMICFVPEEVNLSCQLVGIFRIDMLHMILRFQKLHSSSAVCDKRCLSFPFAQLFYERKLGRSNNSGLMKNKEIMIE